MSEQPVDDPDPGPGGGGTSDGPPIPVPRGFSMVASDADDQPPDPAFHQPPPRPTTGSLLRRTSNALTASFDVADSLLDQADQEEDAEDRQLVAGPELEPQPGVLVDRGHGAPTSSTGCCSAIGANARSADQPPFIASRARWVKTPEPGRFWPPSAISRVPVT